MSVPIELSTLLFGDGRQLLIPPVLVAREQIVSPEKVRKTPPPDLIFRGFFFVETGGAHHQRGRVILMNGPAMVEVFNAVLWNRASHSDRKLPELPAVAPKPVVEPAE